MTDYLFTQFRIPVIINSFPMAEPGDKLESRLSKEGWLLQGRKLLVKPAISLEKYIQEQYPHSEYHFCAIYRLPPSDFKNFEKLLQNAPHAYRKGYFIRWLRENGSQRDFSEIANCHLPESDASYAHGLVIHRILRHYKFQKNTIMYYGWFSGDGMGYNHLRDYIVLLPDTNLVFIRKRKTNR